MNGLCWSCCDQAKLVHPLCLAFWNCSHLDSSSLQWERRAWYVSWDWSWFLIQSLALWYCTACWRTIIFRVSWVLGWGNLHLVTRLEMCWDSACIPLPACCLMLEISLSQWAQKYPLDLMVIAIASRVALGFFISSGITTPLSIRVWRACLSSPSNMSLSCFQPFWLLSAWSGSIPGHPGNWGPWHRRLSNPQTG